MEVFQVSTFGQELSHKFADCDSSTLFPLAFLTPASQRDGVGLKFSLILGFNEDLVRDFEIVTIFVTRRKPTLLLREIILVRKVVDPLSASISKN